MAAPLGLTDSEQLLWTDVVANETKVTMRVGTPRAIVSRMQGSRRSTRRRSLTPQRLREGSWQRTWTRTPSGLPMARHKMASWGLVGAKSA